jgi:hypothetical protein
VSQRSDVKPNTVQRDLAKLPPALAPLIERPQWCVWKWTPKQGGGWQKPPFQALDPDQIASTANSSTWTDYSTALATVQAGKAEGISYVLTKDDPYAAMDLDNCRDKLCSIDVWAQNFMDVCRDTYQEVTPSGTGVRIWGLAEGDRVDRKFNLTINGKPIVAELFRRTNKALTITGYRLNRVQTLTNIDKAFHWAVVWGERRKATGAKATEPAEGNGFSSAGCKYSIDEIEQFVRVSPPPVDGQSIRSEVFHSIVGHYLGIGWDDERIFEHLAQYPDGVGGRYLREGRLAGEIGRSIKSFAGSELPSFSSSGGFTGWETKAPPQEEEQPKEEPKNDPNPKLDEEENEQLEDDDELDDEEEPPKHDPNLPRLYSHRSPDDRPLKVWLIKHLIPQVGHGLMSGQWGAGKTFAFFDLAASLMTGQPFVSHTVKRQCGVLLIAAEGADEVRLRLDAVVREKCGNIIAPFYWYEQAPLLLHKGAVENLIAMARQAEASLQEQFGLPLGLIGIDTIAACAGYSRAGDEYDNAVGQAIMNVLKAVAQELGCFVLAIDHFGKSLEAGTRGASSKEASGDVVLACLGDKQLSGSVTDTRLAVRKHRGGQQGQEYPFALRVVEAPDKDEDGDPISTMVVDWLPPGATQGAAADPPDDPWTRGCRRDDQRAIMSRLKRALLTCLAEQGVEQPIPSPSKLRVQTSTPIGDELWTPTLDGPVVRMVEQNIVREAFDLHTPHDNRQTRHERFKAARDRSEQLGLIGIGNLGEVTYLWLARPDGSAAGAADA